MATTRRAKQLMLEWMLVFKIKHPHLCSELAPPFEKGRRGRDFKMIIFTEI